jgi:cytoskeletal protein CcmA (bactofilin family)
MFKRRENNGEAQVETLIGKSARVHGDVEFAGGLHVDGRVTGNVRAAQGVAASVSVSEHGVIDGSVEAPNVVLNGRVTGDIVSSERVIMGAKARVLGNVHYSVIEMALGAEITGKLVPRTSRAQPAAAAPAAPA